MGVADFGNSGTAGVGRAEEIRFGDVARAEYDKHMPGAIKDGSSLLCTIRAAIPLAGGKFFLFQLVTVENKCAEALRPCRNFMADTCTNQRSNGTFCRRYTCICSNIKILIATMLFMCYNACYMEEGYSKTFL